MHSDTLPIVNIAAYQFAELHDLLPLRDELRQLTAQLQLRGTILLSAEGLNMFVAGSRDEIDALLRRIRTIPGLGGIEVKESFSREQPFNRMLVKIKQEIIAFGVEGIDPRRYTSPRITARELKQWLDEGRPVTLLDTRNNFEVETGTFNNAVAIGVEDFRDFPAAVRKLPEALKKQPIVAFCTGGIRCEKATPFLEREGFDNVYQLDGGILKYFEECGGAHYQGTCFVFDKRVALDPKLGECELKTCFVCRAVLSPADMASDKFVEGVSCPQCYLSDAEAAERRIRLRQEAIQQRVTPLPGSAVVENVRPMSVPERFDGAELLDFLDGMHTHLSRDDWRAVCASGRLKCRNEVVQPGRIMRAGERLMHRQRPASEPDVNADIRVLFEDDSLVIINKPAPLPMHPCGRFNRNTLTQILDHVYQPLHLRPAHRLDADTSGIVVFCKTREVARVVQPQFEAGQVKKRYLARVLGHPGADRFEADWPISAEPGPGGVRISDAGGLPARTLFRVLRVMGDGTTLLDVFPETGRTNQIRIHLWKLQLPIMGDPIYRPGGLLGGNQSLAVTDPPLCLHAAEVEFTHPKTNQIVRFVAPSPAWSASREHI